MTFDPTGPQPESPSRHAPGLSLGRIIGGTVLLAALTVAGTYLFGGFSGVSTAGIIALILGVTFSYALGVGLMVAVFHSSRFYDDSAHDAARDHFKDRHDDS
ncbi:DUF2975 domain-containing protein [Taklimakanibacter lacteus]|uniref:DUF2975 domain-containing protein n=1 Tax=Taklimakanibacter lacteus TaxID=2268456 RepID=UPI000E6743FE